MKTRIGTLTVLVIALACAPALAAPTKVHVRVEGATHTIFEGVVTTDGHQVTGGGSTSHPCDGTNGGANKTPGPTPTSALDDAAKAGGFDWAGSWSDSFQDFLVNRIATDTPTGNDYWSVAVQGKQLQVGGCQAEVTAGQEVLWAFVTPANGKHFLGLRGPHRVRAGKPFLVKAIDEQDGSPIAGARVAGHVTNSRGIAFLRFRHPGTKHLKARRSDSVRSNELDVKVLRRHRHR